MKIVVNADRNLMLEDVFEPIVIRTVTGDFAVCQRDGGIEVSRNGTLVYQSVTKKPHDYLRRR